MRIVPRPTRGGLGPALSLTTASQIAATSSVLALSAIAVSVASALGVSPHLIGYQVSLVYAAGIFISMLAGGLVKRWGAGRVGQLALILAGLGSLAMASASWLGLILGSILIGVGYALNNPSSSHILRKLAPDSRRTLVFSVKQAGVPLGGMLAALAVPPMALMWGWQAAFLIFAVLPFTLALIYLRFIPIWDQDRRRDAKVIGNLIQGQRDVWRNSQLRCLTILGFLYSAVQMSMSAFLITMLITQFQWPAANAAFAAAVMQAAGAIGRVWWGQLADWVGSGFLVLAAVGTITGISCLGFAFLSGPPALSLTIMFFAGLTGLGWNGVVLADTARFSPKGGTLTGEVLTWTFVGVMIGPASFSLSYHLLGSFTTTFGIFSTLAFLGAGLSLYQYWTLRNVAGVPAE